MPYNLLPNSVWKESEIMEEKDENVRADMLNQFKDGTRLNSEYVLRTFPIYHDGLFHGNTNIQMSCTWALAEASRLRKDSAGMKLVGKQLEWVLGDNPFGKSLMYGVGYDFAPHFAYCLKDVVGSLPVGMDCMTADMPHWCATNTATSKEIWVEPVNRFLGAVSIYASRNKLPDGQKDTKNINIQTRIIAQDNGIVTTAITVTGKGKHKVEIKVFNAIATLEKQEIDLVNQESKELEFKLKITDRNKPYVAVISIDNDPEFRKEIVGTWETLKPII